VVPGPSRVSLIVIMPNHDGREPVAFYFVRRGSSHGMHV
jgi:hypothetical protein